MITWWVWFDGTQNLQQKISKEFMAKPNKPCNHMIVMVAMWLMIPIHLAWNIDTRVVIIIIAIIMTNLISMSISHSQLYSFDLSFIKLFQSLWTSILSTLFEITNHFNGVWLQIIVLYTCRLPKYYGDDFIYWFNILDN